jgi:hypothetical protein
MRNKVIADHLGTHYTGLSMILEESHDKGRDALPLRRSNEDDNR